MGAENRPIQVLDQLTIDKIAAGEVVERPSSVVKELVENAIDAGATRITVEIRDGGISLIRVTDNGRGIPEDQIPLAFARHATSKITTAADLHSLGSFGFRGEALSSITAVSRVEMITKSPDSLTATRYLTEGGREKESGEIGAPDGTTIIVRDLFYNVPARAKFLKTASTEGSHVGSLMEQMILSNPDIAFQFLQNGQVKLSSTGTGSLKDAIYHVFGRQIAEELVECTFSEEGLHISGFIGKPHLSRGNRNFENYYVNGRYVKSKVIARGIEEGYGTMLMQHQYPFTCLFIETDGRGVDVNVHPSKMEVRFSDEKGIYDRLRTCVRDSLAHREMVIHTTVDTPEKDKPVVIGPGEGEKRPAEPFETKAAVRQTEREQKRIQPIVSETAMPSERVIPSETAMSSESAVPSAYAIPAEHVSVSKVAEEARDCSRFASAHSAADAAEAVRSVLPAENPQVRSETNTDAAEAVHSVLPAEETSVQSEISALGKTIAQTNQEKPVYEQQSLELTETTAPGFLDAAAKDKRRIIGQVFLTYWLVEYDGSLFIIDQHAAHEKVLFERLMKQYADQKSASQMISPPILLTLSSDEESRLNVYREAFLNLGFEIESFGGHDYVITAVPYQLGNIRSADLFHELLDHVEISDNVHDLKFYIHRVATEACKAAVKGGGRLSLPEAEALFDELMTLEDPYHCPHGRPTIIAFSRQDLEKKFKRIV
ncbi:MAG: DNA mismatch repair endonuclease MutL [Lachnospiraceae bacterium]|nr:DNA mismatch repair endonuclease MutL [Lachnospiraceae bacterium]